MTVCLPMKHHFDSSGPINRNRLEDELNSFMAADGKARAYYTRLVQEKPYQAAHEVLSQILNDCKKHQREIIARNWLLQHPELSHRLQENLEKIPIPYKKNALVAQVLKHKTRTESTGQKESPPKNRLQPVPSLPATMAWGNRGLTTSPFPTETQPSSASLNGTRTIGELAALVKQEPGFFVDLLMINRFVRHQDRQHFLLRQKPWIEEWSRQHPGLMEKLQAWAGQLEPLYRDAAVVRQIQRLEKIKPTLSSSWRPSL